MTATIKPTTSGPMTRSGAIHRVVFGLKPSMWLGVVADTLRDEGYQVEFAPTAEEARQRAAGRADTAVIVGVQPARSFLNTAKIVTALPNAKVILLAPYADERVAQFAEFIDAGIAFESDGPAALIKAILD